MPSSDDRAILDFEESHPRHTGAKEEQIRVSIGLTAARYYQRLDTLLQSPDVVAEYPQLASRRLRQRSAAALRRSEISRLRRTG